MRRSHAPERYRSYSTANKIKKQEVAMKLYRNYLVIAMLVVSFGSAAYAQSQHEMFIPAPRQATFLNDIINGDTTTTGARKDSSRVYVLQRGGVWFWDNEVQNVGWTLTIEGADTGSGPMPTVYAYNMPGKTGMPGNFINAYSDVHLKDVMFDGMYDLDPTWFTTYGTDGVFLEHDHAGGSIYVDSCVIANAEYFFRITGAVHVASITNSILANYYTSPRSGMGSGRVFEGTNVSFDSVLFVNNTIVNGTAEVVRHTPGGRFGVFIFNHNTVVNNMGTFGFLNLGEVGSLVQIKDNLLLDPQTFGEDTTLHRQFQFPEANQFYPDGKTAMPWIYHVAVDTFPGKVPTVWDIKDNYWKVSPQIQAAYDTINANGWDSVWAGPPLDSAIIKQLSHPSTAFLQESDLTFKNVPAPAVGMLLYRDKPASLGGAAGANSGGNFVDMDKRIGLYYRDTLNCSYPTTLACYTGTTDGFPAGDLNWFPSEMAKWKQTLSVQTVSNSIPTQFALSQNYPNPFNPSTDIRVSLRKSGPMSLTIYNVLGEVVKVVDQGYKPAGVYMYNVNMDNFASGVYFYSLRQGSNMVTKKMLLLK